MIPPVILAALALALALPMPAVAQTSRLPAIALIQQQTSGCPVSAREQASLDALRELGLVPGPTIHVERLCHAGTDDLRASGESGRLVTTNRGLFLESRCGWDDVAFALPRPARVAGLAVQVRGRAGRLREHARLAHQRPRA